MSVDTSTRAGDIAIVGIGCRLPGSANSPAAFWRLLRDGVDAITEMPPDRFDLERLFDADPLQPGKIYTRWGGFMDAVDGFDSTFFGLSPREVIKIDPQHRLLLEVTWEALEDAGLPADRMAGTSTGVFIGISTHDYGDIEMHPINQTLLDGHSNSGTASSIAANRISYLFDFRGPSFIVDTACSSALTAIHLACQSLRSGESTHAIAGGVQLLLGPELTMGFCRASMLSPDGRCRAFDARANGYVRSEGAGVVVLRPLADAIANGDPIYAVIKGSAINQDGRTNGMTVPSAEAQEKMLRQALSNSGLSARDVQYVEAHGPGTAVGDPIEAEGLGAVMRDGRGADEPCLIGSVKTNIGHLEAASGAAGIIKTALAIHHRQIPASLHYLTGNPAIDFTAQRLRVVTELTPWPAGAPATAGLNSFGFGGANAHVILQEAPAHIVGSATGDEAKPRLLMLSAKSEDALRALARAYVDHIQIRVDLSIRDLTWSSARRRAHLDHRLTVVGSAREDFLDGLDAFLSTETRADVASGRRSPSTKPKIAFVFSGMGPQWWGMGRQLIASEPLFRNTIERCDAALRRTDAGWSLQEELLRDEATSRVSNADFAQVTNFAIQAALSTLWRSWGIHPEAVIGHSAGEMAAAWTAGIFDLETGVRLAYHRGRLQNLASGEGRMLAVGCSPADVEVFLRGHEHVVSLAAVNSPAGITLSGDATALESISQKLQAQQVFARFLPVDVPYHSTKMDKIEREIRTSLADLELSDAQVPMVSIVSADWTEGRALDAGYWWRNIRQPVLFSPGIEKLIDAGFDTFVEVSPHPVLAQSMQETITARGARGVVLPSLRRMEGERHIMLRTLGALHVRGCDADLAAVYADDGRYAPLPTYRWQRERQWFVPNQAASAFVGSGEKGPHPLLTSRLPSAMTLWETPLAGSATAYLDDHLVQGAVVYPGAAYVETGLGAARALAPGKIPALRDVTFHRALFIPDRAATRLQFSVTGDEQHFEVHSLATGASEWTRHATGTIAPRDAADLSHGDLDAIRLRCQREMPRDDFYAEVSRRGVQLQHAFKGIQSIWLGDGEAIARLATQGFDREGYEIHPAFLDAMFQPLIAAAASLDDTPQSGLFLPIRIAEIVLHARPDHACWSHARVTNRDEHGVTGDVHIYADDGSLAVTVRALACTILDSSNVHAESVADWLYDYAWELQPLDADGAARSLLAGAATTSLDGLNAEADRLSSEWAWDRYYTEVEPQLDSLATSYVALAMRELGFVFEPRARVDLDTFATGYGVNAAKKPLLRSMFVILADAGAFQTDGTGWIVVRDPHAGAARDKSAALTAAFPRYGLEIGLLDRCGSNLAAVLRGEKDSATILFAGESFETMQAFYREAPTTRLYNTLVGEAISRLVASANAPQPLRILEIGGGTGGTTTHVLPHLAGTRVDYVFTDVSPFFTQRALEQFGGRDGFATRVFDVERSPVDQGFTPASFDLVIASNVIHTTKSLAGSLAHLESLVAPGGALVLMEVTRHPHWVDLIFGLTEGWWRFEDYELRSNHPILPAAGWVSLLAGRGWSSIETLSDSNRPGEAAQTVLSARWEGLAETTSSKRWLVFADAGGVASRVVDHLDRTIVVRPGDRYRRIDAASFEVTPGQRDHLAALLRELHGEGTSVDGVLHFWSLDAAPPESLTPASLRSAHNTGVGSVLALLQALEEIGRTIPELWLLTSASQPMTGGPELLAVAQAPIWGLARVINREQPDVRCRAVDLSAAPDDNEISMLLRDLRSESAEEELALRDGLRFVRRLRRRVLSDDSAEGTAQRPAPDDAWQVEVGTPGMLGSIRLRQMQRLRPGPGEVEVRVLGASVNFREVVLATNAIPGLENESPYLKRQLGVDCAGIVTAIGEGVDDVAPGDEVIAFASGTHRAFAITSQRHVLPKPAMLTFEQGASIPGVFLTAHYALHQLAQIRKGDRVLIHAATGGVGLAAIEIARDAGAEIFATAGNPEKRAYLASIGVPHIMNSRTLDFVEDIMTATGGEGVDIVLNSLAGEAMTRSMAVLAPFGRFVEIGKKDLYADSRVGIGALRQNISYYTLDVDQLVAVKSEEVRRTLADVLDRIADGRYRLSPITVFPFSQTEGAVRLMAQGRHIGKIVLTADDPDLAVLPLAGAVALSGDATVLITGGMGGFGFAVAERLVKLGARHLVLAGRGNSGDEADARLDVLRSAGADVVFERCDVTDGDDVARMIARIRGTLPPLRGVIHAAMVLDDAPLGQLSTERLHRVMGPKAAGAWNLHEATKDEPLDFFTMFSSITSLMGTPLQANYAAANAFLDALCYYRRACGLAAQTINWGVLSGVGWVAQHVDIANHLARQGYLSFSPDQALEAFEELLKRDPVHITAARIDWKAWVKSSPLAASSPRMQYFWTGDGADEQKTRSAGDLTVTALLDASVTDRPARLEEYLRARVGKVLGIASTRIDPERPLNEMGLDSLMAVELMTVLKMDLSVGLPVVKLLQGITIGQLGTMVDAQLAAPSERTTPRAPAPVEARLQEAPQTVITVDLTAAPKAKAALQHLTSVPTAAGFDRRQRVARHVIGASFRIATKLDVEGLEHFPATGGCIVAANHLSLADGPLLFTVLPRPTVLFASDHLRHSAWMRWLLTDIGEAIWVRRGEGDQDALRQGFDVLARGGVLGIGPEGTRSRTGGLGRGHTGPAYLAARSGAPVIPIAAWGHEKMRRGWTDLRRPPIHVVVGAPIVFAQDDAPAAADLVEMTATIMRAIAAMLPVEYRGVYTDRASEDALTRELS